MPSTATAAAQGYIHRVRCHRCHTDFDLLAAAWCRCDSVHPSKICPACEHCLCDHPDYRRSSLWGDPPMLLRDAGFDKLFVYYL